MSLEEVAAKCAQEFGYRAGYYEAVEILEANGMLSPNDDVVNRLLELVRGSIIRVKVLPV